MSIPPAVMKPTPKTAPEVFHPYDGKLPHTQGASAASVGTEQKWHCISSRSTSGLHPSPAGTETYADAANHGSLSDGARKCNMADEDSNGSVLSLHAKEADVECSRKLSLYIMFVLLGCTSLICWNFLIQALPFILLQKLDRPELNNLFLGVYQVANIVMQMVLMTLSKPQPLLVVFASMGSGTLGLMLAIAVAIMPHQPLSIDQDMDVYLREQTLVDKDPMNYAQQCLFGVMLLLSILMGCCQGLIQGVGYTLSCQIAPGYVGSVSLGQGAAGLLVFCISTISCFFIFDVNTADGLIQFCFMSFGIVAVTAFAFAAFFYIRAKRPDIAESLARVSHINHAENVSSDKRLDVFLTESRCKTWGFQLWGRKVTRPQAESAEGGKILWIRVMLASWKELGLAFFHFSYTYHLYPSVGPLGWRYSWTFPNQIVVLYGVWFLFETIGRAAPDLGWVKGLGWLRPSRKAYAPISLSTLVFLVPFLLGYLSKPGSFVTDPIWYMFVMSSFAFCHGWIGTLAFFYACNAVDDPRERMVAGPLTVLSVGFGCVVGFLTSLAY